MNSMRCASCGIQNSIKNGFCKSCGTAFIDDNHHPRLGQYVLLAKIGEGGMGVVYRARDESLDREVAIKVLHPHLLKQENLKERFRREARVHGKVQHPNIVTLLSLYEDDEYMALVMEMVHGQNLRQFLRDKPTLSLLDVLNIADEILVGLEASHQVDVIHRDIKPSNVLLTDDGKIKLMDFGLAKPQSGEDDLTKSGATVGSFRYMSPEQILNQQVDIRTDLYSFGIVLYEMCTGQLPFDAAGDGAAEFEIMEKQVREEPVEPRKLNRSLPKELSELILSLLSKRPDDRPASCAEVRAALKRIKQAPSARDAAALKKTIQTRPRKRSEQKPIDMPARYAQTRKAPSNRPRWLAALALIAVIGGWYYYQQNQQQAAQQNVSQEMAEPAPKSRTMPAEVAPPAKSEVKKAAVEQTPVVIQTESRMDKTRSVTFTQTHWLRRFDGTESSASEAHEFRGGSKHYFDDLRDYTWKNKLHTFKQGWIRVSFNVATSISTIVIQRASVGKKDFSGGNLSLRVINNRGKFFKVFEQKDRDIDRPVVVKLPASMQRDIKSVEFRFRSAEPITIGPIDLLP